MSVTINIYYKLVNTDTGEIWTSTGVEGVKLRSIDFSVKAQGNAGPASLTLNMPTREFARGDRFRAYIVMDGTEVLLLSGKIVTETWDGELYSYTIVDDNNFDILIPGRIYGRGCDFVFGRQPCGFDLSGAVKNVTITALGQNYVDMDTSLEPEYRRLVQDNADTVGYEVDGARLFVTSPQDFDLGSAQVYPVCSKDIEACIKFGQSLNFGGFLYTPKASDTVY